MNIITCKNCNEQMINIGTNTHLCPANGNHYLIRDIANESYTEMPELSSMHVVKEKKEKPSTEIEETTDPVVEPTKEPVSKKKKK